MEYRAKPKVELSCASSTLMENEDVHNMKARFTFTGDFFLKLVDVRFGLQKKRYHLWIHEQVLSGISGEYDL